MIVPSVNSFKKIAPAISFCKLLINLLLGRVLGILIRDLVHKGYQMLSTNIIKWDQMSKWLLKLASIQTRYARRKSRFVCSCAGIGAASWLAGLPTVDLRQGLVSLRFALFIFSSIFGYWWGRQYFVITDYIAIYAGKTSLSFSISKFFYLVKHCREKKAIFHQTCLMKM